MKKKSSFLTFCCALVPGAGQMYLGMMKRGVSLMILFALFTAVSGFFNMGILNVFLPVIWFYSFFDTFNIRAMNEEERAQHPDRFLFDTQDLMEKDWKGVMKKRHTLWGGIFIFIGVYMLFQNFVLPAAEYFYEISPFIYRLIHELPTLVVAILIVLLGFYLILGSGKKHVVDSQEKEDRKSTRLNSSHRL